MLGCSIRENESKQHKPMLHNQTDKQKAAMKVNEEMKWGWGGGGWVRCEEIDGR